MIMMPSSAKLSIHEITQLGVLLAAAIALRLAETSLAWLLPLIVLYLYGPGKGALFLASRILLTGLLFTGLLSPGFLIGLGGAALSFVGMALGEKHHWFSTIGIGLLGAFLHNCGQILMAVVIMRTPALFSYLPVLIAIGIPTGLFTGFLAGFFLERMKEKGPAA
mgnify:CR=1 FL=1